MGAAVMVLAGAAKSPLTTVPGLVIALGALGAVAGVIGSAMAFLTRAVRESHAAALNETAATVARRVESGMFTDYGDEHRDRPMRSRPKRDQPSSSRPRPLPFPFEGRGDWDRAA